MKPKITCDSCGAELEWGVARCGSCKTVVEWPDKKEPKAAAQKGKQATSSSIPMKNIVAVVAFIAVGVVVLEYVSSSGTVPEAVNQQAQGDGHDHSNDHNSLAHIEELEETLKANPENQAVRRELANHLMDGRFYDRAIAAYQDFLDRDPSDPNIRVDMGICYKEIGDLESAEREMQKALTYEPTHLYAHFNLGIVNLVQGEIDNSNEWFKKAAQLDPGGQLGQRALQLIQQHGEVNVQ
jgi:Flp pilus assembly protein TadD